MTEVLQYNNPRKGLKQSRIQPANIRLPHLHNIDSPQDRLCINRQSRLCTCSSSHISTHECRVFRDKGLFSFYKILVVHDQLAEV